MIEFCVPKDELEKALAALKQAEANGFLYCMPVFSMLPGGRGQDEWVAVHDDLVIRTAPDDLNADYGRARGTTIEQRFENGAFVDNEVLSQRCSACGGRQIVTPSGVTCLQGHAGVVAAPPMVTCEHQFEAYHEWGQRCLRCFFIRELPPAIAQADCPHADVQPYTDTSNMCYDCGKIFDSGPVVDAAADEDISNDSDGCAD